jgi:hypothetical protein
MNRPMYFLAVAMVLGLSWLLTDATSAQQTPRYPLDDKLANEPAPWAVAGKWGKRGNWGRWGEEDKRGMLNYITPEMVVEAAALVKKGKVYALGEELTSDVPRVITPARIGIQVIQENDGYDRVAAKSGEFDPKRQQGAASFTFMHNHTGSHLDTLGHIYRENALYNNLPPPKALGTAQGDAASVIQMVGRGVLLDVAGYKGNDPLPVDYWITAEDLQNTAKSQNVEIRKGDTAESDLLHPVSDSSQQQLAAEVRRSLRFVENAPLLTKLAEADLGEARERLPASRCIVDRAVHAGSGAAMR